jgi:hypothetical protein
MLDNGFEKVLKNSEEHLKYTINKWLEKGEKPSDKEWEEYTRRFMKHFEYKEKVEGSKYPPNSK